MIRDDKELGLVIFYCRIYQNSTNLNMLLINICCWINKISLMVQSKVTATCFLKLLWIVPFGTVNADCWSNFYMFKKFSISELAFLLEIGTRKHSGFSERMSPENSVLWKYSTTVTFRRTKQFSSISTILLAPSIWSLNLCIRCNEHTSFV